MTALSTTRLSALLGCVHACERALLAGLPDPELDAGDPLHWSPRAVLAHNSDFRREQVTRLRAAAGGFEPPTFGQVDHRDPDVYRACHERPWPAILAAVDQDLADMIAALDAVAAADLADSTRLPWMHGRPLWAQVLVRGVWHPLGHLATCLVEAGRPDQAAAAVEAIIGAARALAIPAAPGGVAFGVYTLAAVRALAGERAEALRLLRAALADDPALAANAARDPDFDGLRGDPAFPC